MHHLLLRCLLLILSLVIPTHPFTTKLQATIGCTRQPNRVRCGRGPRALNPLIFAAPLLDTSPRPLPHGRL
jgi:hypothetical protein